VDPLYALTPRSDPKRPISRPDVVAALAAPRVTELRRHIDCLASAVALLPASPRRAAVQAIERDIAELLRHLGVVGEPTARPPRRQ
jgi:hypothetical protein